MSTTHNEPSNPIVQDASHLIDSFGDRALMEAAERANERHAKGDREGRRHWIAVAWKVQELN